MDNDQDNVRRIFSEAADLRDEERAAFLKEACGADEQLRASVERLLKHDAEVGSFMDAPVVAPAPTIDQSPAEQPGTMIGPYKLVEEIGEGGMGSVFMAVQKKPVRRKVALKVIKPGMDSRQVVSRFDAERQALAMMDHPNIARVFDGGATEPGRPYFVMELVKGIPITDYCDRYRLTTNDRLELFGDVCRAVQHAHQKGIIHRDLKPSNILVTLLDGRAIPKVIDFGIAKATSGHLTDETLVTAFSQMVGTPMYMSPEQVDLSAADVDTRSDVYSLGVLLYELLTGTTPFDRERIKEVSYDEFRRIIREEEPPRPSTRLSTLDVALDTVAKKHQADPHRLSQQVSGELDWIVMKSLEKDRSRRYESANELAKDVQRYLDDEAVEACPPSATYRLKKFARRNRALLTTMLLVLAALVTGMAASLWQASEAHTARRLANQRFLDEQEARREADEQSERAEANEAQATDEAAKATAVVDFLQKMLGSANPSQAKGADYTVRELLDHFLANLDDQLNDQPEVEAELRSTIGMVYWRLTLHDKAAPHLGAALELRRRIYGNEHEKVAQSLVDYAWAEGERGNRTKFAKGLALAREAVAIYRKTGSQPEGVIHALRVVQFFLQSQGNYAEADAIGREALAIAQEANRMETQDVADILSSLAMSILIQGDHSEAVRLGLEAVALHRRVHGNEHPETGHGLGTLAGALEAQGDLTTAEAHYRETLAIFRKQYGDYHPVVTWFLRKLGAVLRAQGKPEEAEESYRAFLSQTPYSWRDYMERAGVHAEMGKHELALADREKGVALLEKLVTKFPDQPDRAARLNSEYSTLGNLLRDIGRLDDAEKAYRKAMAISEKLTTDFPTEEDYWNQYRDNCDRLIKLLKSNGRAEEAKQILHGMKNPRTADTETEQEEQDRESD